ncbi:TonB-dependent receptor domain-containing protein [Shimia sp. Alg240-R146]|uniref:TonB-dependent receptor domain-containing protein n=1 Tax=Shimia sp. Alg240-R146 TaxID=2993449 RepID=UPI0022E82237|nr:TonB-dependent receptor [Shimia sp. Alg240-R146]
MRACISRKAVLLCSAALISATPALAQDGPSNDYVDGVLLLDEIELKRSKRDIKTETATSVTVIEQEEMDDRQATTIGELVDSVPGVTLINGATPQGSGINIRGFGANGTYGSDQKVLIQVDGATVGSEELYRISTQLFTDPQLYKEVTVLRGLGGSFEYGSGAIGGVLLLETKDAADFTGGEVGFRFRQTLQANSNGDGISSSSILAWQPTENFEVLGNVTYSTQNNQKDGSGAVIGNSEFALPSYALKMRGHFGDDRAHRLEFSLSNSSVQERDVPYDSFGTTADSFGNVDRDIENTAGVLTYGYNPVHNDLIDLQVQFSYADQKIDQSYVAGSSPLEGTSSWPFLEPLVNADHRYETSKLLLKNNAMFTTGRASHDMRFGVELSQRKRLDASSAPGGTDERLAVFIVDEIDFGNGLTITPGMRFEDQTVSPNDLLDPSYDNSALMGGVSAQYKFASGWSVFGSAGYTESMPVIDDLGNPLFMTQSEKARNYELGVGYSNTGIFNDQDAVAFKATVYKTDIWNITSYNVPGGFDPIDTVDMHGLELEARYSHDNGFYSDVNLNLQRGEYHSDAAGTGGDWEQIPADQLRLTLGKRWGREWDLSWEVVANAKMSRSTSPSASNLVNNLRATYRPQASGWNGLEVRMGVENMFDADYTPHLATRPAPGRTFKLSLAKTF